MLRAWFKRHGQAALPNICVLGTLAFLAMWGHATAWTFTRWTHGPESPKSAMSSAKEPDSRDIDLAAAVEPVEMPPATARELASTGIRLGHPMARMMEEHVTAHGVVHYVQTKMAQLSARVPGTVWQVNCQVGDSVRQGDVLAVLDAVEVGRAKAEFLQALVQAELKQQSLVRLQSAGEAVSLKNRREAEAALREALVTRYNTQQTLINLGLSIHFDDLAPLTDEERAERIHFLGLPPELVRGRDPEDTSANLIPVRAPFDGVVIRREIVVGEVVSPEHSQLAIADVSRMWLQLHVSKEHALQLAIGQAVSFTGDGLPGVVESRVSWISTEVDEKTRTVLALAEVDNPPLDGQSPHGQRLLKANMFGAGKIRIRANAKAIVIPSTALHWHGDEPVVFVARAVEDHSSGDGEWTFEARKVRPGASDDGYTEILEGLVESDSIVIDGGHMLKSELSLPAVSQVP